MNHDGQYEFELRHFNPGAGMESVELQSNPDGIQEVLIDSLGHSVMKKTNDSITATLGIWGHDQFGILDDAWYSGTDAYIGTRFKLNNQWHYGWIRINIAVNRLSFVIKDYAYQQLPLTGIKAGHGMTGLAIPTSPQVAVFPNPSQTSITFSVDFPESDAELHIWSSAGQKLFPRINTTNGQLILEKGELPEGIYLYQLFSRKNGKLVSTGKLHITG